MTKFQNCFSVCRALVAGFAITGLVLSFQSAPASAAPDTQPTKNCKSGYVWSNSKGKCVKKTSQLLNDNDLYATASQLVEQGDYENAQDLLYRIKDQKQPRVLTYIGFTTRKMGRVEDAIRYYKLALGLDPNYVQARQYLGEGYLQLGDVSSARQELREIENRCGQTCEHYVSLAEQITSFEVRKS